MSGSEGVEIGAGHERVVTERREELDSRLQQLTYGMTPTDPSDGAVGSDQGPTAPSSDPGSAARLVGDEVTAVLEAAEVAARSIRARARDVAAEVQRQIRDMQGTLARLALEIGNLLKTIDDGAQQVTTSISDADEGTEVDLALLLDDPAEERPTRIRP